MSDTELRQALARLSVLKEHLPEERQVHEQYVKGFHEILDFLTESSDGDLDSFRVPSSEVRPRMTSVVMGTPRNPGRKTYSEDSYCDRAVLMMKLDGVLTLFQLESKDTLIGFTPPGN